MITTRIIYDKRRNLDSSLSGYDKEGKETVIIGTRDKPTPYQIGETIQHETAHLKVKKVTKDVDKISHVARAWRELQAYEIEKRRCTPKQWNRVLPTRLESFLTYASWLNKNDKRVIKNDVIKILRAKPNGGNLLSIKRAKDRLIREWNI